MTWIIVVLIVLVVLLLAGVAWTATQRKRDQAGRVRANELRSEAAQVAVDHPVQEARAREAAAEADQARAQADALEARAHQERVGYDQSRAEHEDRLREADQVDPDVDPGVVDPGVDPGAHSDLDGGTTRGGPD